MNTISPLAEELNHILDTSHIGTLLSQTGRALFFPKGIVAQSAEAKTRAHRFNATVGMAYQAENPMTTKTLTKLIPTLTPKEIVSYAPTGGLSALREAWQQVMMTKNPSLASTRISLPVVTSGITHGISIVADLFLDPEDTVLLPDMRWGNYDLIFAQRRNARIVSFPFFSQHSTLNLEALEQALQNLHSMGKKVILLWNFPNNPTGYSPSHREVKDILSILKAAATRGLSLLVLSDDAYFGLCYEDQIMKESLFPHLADLHESITAIKLDGVTKEEFSWGLRVGFLTIGGKNLTEEHIAAFEKKCLGAIRSSVSNVSNLSQHLMLRVIRDPDYQKEKQAFFEMLNARYKKTKEVVASLPTFPLRALPFNSGYFMTFQCPTGTAEALRMALLEKGIGIIAIRDEYIRVTFASIDSSQIDALFKAIFETAHTVCTAD